MPRNLQRNSRAGPAGGREGQEERHQEEDGCQDSAVAGRPVSSDSQLHSELDGQDIVLIRV